MFAIFRRSLIPAAFLAIAASPCLAAASAEDVALVRGLIATWRTYDASPAYGGVVLFEEDFNNHPDRACEVKERTPNALVMTDQEGGPVVRLRTHDTEPMAPASLKATTPDQYRQHSQEVARALKELCIDINLAPVVEPAFPQRPIRSASLDLTETTAFADAFSEGMIAGGIIPVLKHYPGFTGNARPASDHPDVKHNRPGSEPMTVRDRDGLSIKTAASFFHASFPRAVMLANNIYPSYGDHPASMTPVFAEWLRQGFDGLIITDALDELTVTPELVRGVANTADMFMILAPADRDRFEQMLLDAIADGSVSREALYAKLDRINRYRAWSRHEQSH
jgi:beta-N-acetylhexosaminidase